MSPPLKTDQKKKGDREGGERTKPLKPNRAQTKAEELAGGEGRQQTGPGTKANTVPKKGGREEVKAWEMASQPQGNKTSSFLQRRS